MGRKPNPLILEHFIRGAKLNDNSNRYQHTCRRCGENFPKGRIDSLTAHITRKCPAISDSDRMRACLGLHGISSARAAAAAAAAVVAERPNNKAGPRDDAHALPASALPLPPEWSALETLAEASRQVDLNENNRGHVQAKDQDAPIGVEAANLTSGRFELQEQFTLDNPPTGYHDRGAAATVATTNDSATAAAAVAAVSGKSTAVQVETDQANAAKLDINMEDPHASPNTEELSPEERLQALIPVSGSPDAASISVAVAATARLNPSFLDPQLVGAETPAVSSSGAEPSTAMNASHPLATDSAATQPWGEMTFVTATIAAPPLAEKQTPSALLNRGGVRMDTSDNSILGRPRHSRSRFTPARRKEVQEVRKIGACIRCRILRKNCGKGDPCDTCRKVFAPRVWRTGCVRTRLHEQLDLYSAGVQVVLSQNRINLLKEQLQLANNGNFIDVSHFPEAGKSIVLGTLEALLEPSESQAEARNSTEPFRQAIMIDQDTEDIPSKIEAYMRDVLPLFIAKEPSKFTRVMLETAVEQQAREDDDLLNKALELWGLVESIDRERQWTILEKRPRPAGGQREGSTGTGTGADAGAGAGAGAGAESGPELEPETRWISETDNSDGDADVYTMICMQLNAAAERKANSTSRSLLNHMDRLLTDSKTRVGFRVYLAALVFLACVEKSTWAFRAWEQDHLRPGWPLERDPGVFARQGGHLAGLLRMLLTIRKALPMTARGDDGRLVAQGQDPVVVEFFDKLDLDFDSIAPRQKGLQFSPADSRSLELMFCSHLLLPNSPV